TVSDVTMRILAFVLSGLTLFGILWVGAWLVVWLVIYPAFPEYFGHYRFYRTCKSLRPGTTLQDARTAMAPFLEVGTKWKPPGDIPAGIMSATVMRVDETRKEHDSRVLFIPDARNIADWCIVYPENGKVRRV